jgi:putative PIN family toxin of toxin-antitoxin system
LRAVLDTNILISAFVFPGGTPETVYRLALEERVQLVTSPTLLAEFGRVLMEKFGWSQTRAGEAVAQVARVGLVLEPSERVRAVTADPTDDRVLEAASEGKADTIISGDRHLLRLGSWQGVPIVTAATFVAEFE